jgi:ribonucleoside-diphosphate reductase alpha chain
MATSILDYVFRELAVSYLGRHDLAHAEPHDILPDAMGDGEQAEKLLQIAGKAVSQGFVRSSNVFHLKNHNRKGDVGASGGGSDAVGAQSVGGSMSPGNTVAMASGALAMNPQMAQGAFAAEEVKVTRVTEVTETRRSAATVARMKGYEGDACGECGNFTLVRNGTCMKCDTCGGTSGCS